MSTRITLEERGRTLEEEFFRKEEREKRARLREKLAREHSIDDLRRDTGIVDEVVLGHLVDAGVRAESLVAFTLVPLVAVAWADGSVKDAEREAVLQAARQSGVEEGTPAHETLERMLQERPSPRLFTAWTEYAEHLNADLPESQRAVVASDIVGRARTVAEAAGGFLGIGSVSREESAKLDEIEAALR